MWKKIISVKNFHRPDRKLRFWKNRKLRKQLGCDRCHTQGCQLDDKAGEDLQVKLNYNNPTAFLNYANLGLLSVPPWAIRFER